VKRRRNSGALLTRAEEDEGHGVHRHRIHTENVGKRDGEGRGRPNQWGRRVAREDESSEEEDRVAKKKDDGSRIGAWGAGFFV
jgi:hypothetical protein